VRHRVGAFDATTLRFLAAFGGRGSGDGQLCDPGGLAVAGGELFVCDVSNHRLSCFALSAHLPPTFSRNLGRRGSVPGAFHQPHSVATARDLLVVSEKTRLQVLTTAGVPQQIIAPPGCGSLGGLAIRGAHLIVADSEARRLHEFALKAAAAYTM